MQSATNGALGEWRRYGLLPIAAALGYASCVIHIYGLGVYIEPIAKDFGWSRTQVTAGLTLSTVIQVFTAIPVGLAIDRFGPRILAVIGVPLACLAFANLGSSTGGIQNWYVNWIIMSLASLPIQATVWTSAVASRFAHSRGLALAVTLCGASVALSLFPWLGAKLIESHGWRQAMRLEALIWVVIAYPVIALLFRGAHDRQRKGAETLDNRAELGGVTLAEGLRTGVFLRLLVAAVLFTLTVIGLNIHFPLVLQSYGFAPLAAAGTASLIGIASIFGRIGTGLLLDRISGAVVGAIAFAMPVLTCALLLWGGGNPVIASIAAMLLGVTLGAEIDVLVFLTSRHFGLKSFGSLYGGILAALSVGTAFGPLIAAQVFDHWKNYDLFLWATAVLMIVASLALATLPQPPPAEELA